MNAEQYLFSISLELLERRGESRDKLVFQFPALDFAGGVRGDFIDEEVMSRALEVGEIGASATEGIERAGVELRVFTNDCRADDHAPLLAGKTDDRGIRDALVLKSTFSTSDGWIFSAPDLIVWSVRPITVMKPWSSANDASPEKYQPYLIAAAVRSGRLK